MKKRNAILFTVWIVLIGAALALSFRTYVIQKDFQVLMHTACDPTKETCFVYTCNSNSIDEICNDKEPGVHFYYTYIFKRSYAIPSCDARSESCESLTCDSDEAGCEKVICSDEALKKSFVPEGVLCSIFVPAPVIEPEPAAEEPLVITPDPIFTEPQPGIILDDPTPVFAPDNDQSTPVVSPTTPEATESYDPSTDTSL